MALAVTESWYKMYEADNPAAATVPEMSLLVIGEDANLDADLNMSIREARRGRRSLGKNADNVGCFFKLIEKRKGAIGWGFGLGTTKGGTGGNRWRGRRQGTRGGGVDELIYEVNDWEISFWMVFRWSFFFLFVL